MDPPTAEEIELLQELRERLADLELSEEYLEDKNLVRFLRARSANLDAAELMIRNNREWQVAEDVKSLLADYVAPKGYDEEFYYAMTGFCRNGNPIILCPFGKWDIHKETCTNGNKEEFIRYIHHHMERMWTFVKNISKKEDHMKQAVGIVDLGGLSYRQCISMDVAEASIRCLKSFEANYPETIQAAVVVNAPWAFQIIWKLLKPFLSEHTHSKLAFIGNDKEKWREAISKYADLDQFPEYYGGTLPDNYKIYVNRNGQICTSENQNESEDKMCSQINQ